jgi:hypothetical protein
MKLTFTLAFLCTTFSVLAQGTFPTPGTQKPGSASANLDVTNINPLILNAGDAFWDLYDAKFEVPRGSGKNSIFAGALWLGGRDNQNNLYVSAQTYRQRNQVSLWPGPVGTIQGPVQDATYNKIWKVSNAQIQYHIKNYWKKSYHMPADIAAWPAHGKIGNDEAADLAPFVDTDNDGIYSPQLGDYPSIKGDQALYLILNDKGNYKTPASRYIGAEVHVMYYGYNNSEIEPVYNTVFSEYRIINRGQINMQDMYAGIWSDFDLGNWSDDYVGCDTTTNRFFVYNGDNFDDDTVITIHPGTIQAATFNPNGYGLNPPVQSVTFLDRHMSHFVYYNNDPGFRNGNPTGAKDYYNYLRGIWLNNDPITYGGDGTNQNNSPATHMFAGDPVAQTGWSERNTLTTPSSNVPYDRRALGSFGPFNLYPGQEVKFTVAYTYSRGNSNLNSVVLAQQDAQTVQNFFRTYVPQRLIPEKAEIAIQPNPASNDLQIQLPTTFSGSQVTVLVSDNLGRVVLKSNADLHVDKTLDLNISNLKKGIYQVTVKSDSQTSSARLVKE